MGRLEHVERRELVTNSWPLETQLCFEFRSRIDFDHLLLLSINFIGRLWQEEGNWGLIIASWHLRLLIDW